jgi:Domain of unknown function (DUF4332)
MAASGDQAAAEGQLSTAYQDYTGALIEDRDNQAAMSGLQTVDQQVPDGIREARDHWNQIVSDTLVPIGQFFLWFLAALAGIYILYLLTRVGARWLRPLKPEPSWRRRLKISAVSFFCLAAVAAGVTAYIGTSAQRSAWRADGLWLISLAAAAASAATGCLLTAWYLRSGAGVQFSVIDKGGDDDQTATAFLAGRLNALGTKPPRGFDLPQDTDVTTLTAVLALLPGGGLLSALANFFLARVQVTPWNCVVTLIDEDQLLVTLHRNGRLAGTVLANRKSLFFPSQTPGQGAEGASPYVKDIDQGGMLTVAAAIILVGMALADTTSPLQLGLSGATRWESVAGQVLATQQGFGGNEDLSKALLARAVDVDPGNLAARVAKTVMDGRRATDSKSREDFAKKISEIGRLPVLKDPGYEALQLRVFYSSAAGWYNVYLDSNNPADLREACRWSNCLINQLGNESGSRQPQELVKSMKPIAFLLGAALRYSLKRYSGIKRAQAPLIPSDWEPGEPRTSGAAYDRACLEAVQNNLNKALEYLKQAVVVNADLRIWARYDPSFKQLLAHDKAGFAGIVFDEPPDSFTGVGPLASHATKLNEIGVHTAADLVAMTSTNAERLRMAHAVGVSQLVIARWRNIARLSGISGEPDGLRKPDSGQLDVLVTQDIDSPEALQLKVHEDLATLVRDIQAATKHSAVTIAKEDLELWARSAETQ